MSDIRVGDIVRTTARYGEIMGEDMVGVEFEVTDVMHSPWESMDGERFEWVISGDPRRNGIWANFLEKVEQDTVAEARRLAWLIKAEAISSSALAEGMIAVKADQLRNLISAVGRLEAK